MTFYLIGLGASLNSIRQDSKEILKSCKEIFLESYTVDFPYKLEELESSLNVKINPLKRGDVENNSFLESAKEKDVALLVYGDPLSATTHHSIILECIDKKIKYKIFQNESILTLVSKTGLQIYKFGKTASMPNWKEHKNYPTSFIKILKENDSINAHSLILTDIGLKLEDAIIQLEESCKKEKHQIPEKIIVLSHAGTNNERIYFENLKNLKKMEIKMPYCIIIPKNLHFIETEYLEKVKQLNLNKD